MPIWPNPITHPEYYDPFASAERHPQLPAGLNADDVNDDVIDGGGTNWPIWPMLFDTYQGFAPVIVTDEMQEVFDGCADYTVGCVVDEFILPAAIGPYLVGGTWPDIVPPLMNNTIVIPWQPRELNIPAPDSTIMPPGRPTGISIAPEVNEQETRRSQ